MTGERPFRQPRYRVTQYLLMRIGRLFRRITVHNRSELGMMVQAEGLKSGDEVTIELPSGRLVDGIVRWVDMDKAGIHLSATSPPLKPYAFSRIDDLNPVGTGEEPVEPLPLFSPGTPAD